MGKISFFFNIFEYIYKKYLIMYETIWNLIY